MASNLVSTAGPSQNLAYDSHGDIITLADESMTYDQTGRHVSTTTTGAGGATVTYTRDVSGEVVAMATTLGSTTTTVDYSYAGGIQFTLNGTNTAVQEETLSLPGGVTESIQGTTQVWSYPDLHGDDTVTTDGTGTRTGSIALYDPFGDPINLTTGQIGTLAANTSTLTNTTVAGTSYGWEGSHGKQDQTAGDIATIEMGARQYVTVGATLLRWQPFVVLGVVLAICGFYPLPSVSTVAVVIQCIIVLFSANQFRIDRRRLLHSRELVSQGWVIDSTATPRNG